MKRLFCFAAALFAAGIACADEERVARKPNVVVIFVDDMGYGDPGCYGGTEIKTPNVDRLAERGVRFTDGYVVSSVCGPSRVGLLTGAYSQRFGVYWNPDTTKAEIPGEYLLLPEMMRSAGYATGVIGKWNITRDVHESADFVRDPMVWGGNYWPNEDGTYPGVGGGWGDDKQQGVWGPKKPGDEYLTDRLTQQACNFIEANTGNPFFLYLAYNAPHSPLQAQRKFADQVAHIESEPDRFYAAMVMAMDAGVGRVLDTLGEQGLEENTLVVFMSDNGPAKGGFKGYKKEWPKTLLGSTGGLRGHKGNLYEGGIRIPYIMSWPGQIKAGSVVGLPVISLDLFPTLAAISGAENISNQHIDGIDLIPLLKGGIKPEPRPLFWASDKQKVVRSGDWKLVVSEPDTVELFNLRNDPREENDQADQEPEVLEDLMAKHKNWLSKLPPPQPEDKKPIIQPGVVQRLKPVLLQQEKE